MKKRWKKMTGRGGVDEDDRMSMKSQSSRSMRSVNTDATEEDGEYEEVEVEVELSDRKADKEEEESRYIMLMEECGSQVSVESLRREHK